MPSPSDDSLWQERRVICDFVSLSDVQRLCRQCGRVVTVDQSSRRLVVACRSGRHKRDVSHGPAQAISVVMPVWNGEKYVRQAIDSILGQTVRDFELILVNDGSTDSTADILQEIAALDPRVRVLHQANGGTGAALNAGFRLARGGYQTWWSADSWVEPEWLEELQRALTEHPEVGFVYSDWGRYLQQSQRVIEQRTPEFDRERLRKDCYVGPCWLWRREVKEQAGEFRTELCEDYDMHLRMANLTPFLRVPKILGYWREHDGNLTATKAKPQNFAPALRVRARHRWQSCEGPRIAWVGPHVDAAAVGWFLAAGLNQVGDNRVAVRHILGHHRHLKQTEDLVIGQQDAEIRQVLDECDLIHCNVCLPDDKYSRIDLRPWLDRGKPLILHLHGGHWPWMTERIAEYQRTCGMKVVSCTPGIAEIVPGGRWMPNLIPVSRWGELHDGYYYQPPDGWPQLSTPLKVMFHHNYAMGKGGEIISAMFQWLRDELGVRLEASIKVDYPVSLREHLQLKKSFDVCIDQITQGFIGMAGWESMAQGAVVIARLDEFSLQAYTRLGQGEPPPILNARWIDEVALFLQRMVAEPEWVLELKRQSRDWMLRHYTAQRIGDLWIQLYEEILKEPRHGR